MTSTTTGPAVPNLVLSSMTLVSLYYRMGKRTIPPQQPYGVLEGNISFSFTDKKKNSFTMKSVQEIKLGEILFRARHQATFTSDAPLNKKLFEDDEFQRTAVNSVLPFGTELFAALTGKTFPIPIVSSPEVTDDEKQSD